MELCLLRRTGTDETNNIEICSDTFNLKSDEEFGAFNSRLI